MIQKKVALTMMTFFFVGACGGGQNRTPMASGNPEIATSTSTKVTKDYDYQGGALTKVLIIGVLADPQLKLVFENTLVTQFRNAGRESVAAHTILPLDQELTKELIRSRIVDTGIDGVLITRLVGAGMVQQETLRTNAPTEPNAALDDTKSSDSDMYGHYSSVYQTVHAPGYAVDTPQVEVKLFEVKEETAVWNLTRSIENPHGRSQIIEQLGETIVESLLEQGLM
jgi:hypothetical protein